MSFGLSTTNVDMIVNQSISNTMELMIIDSDKVFTDGVMGSGASGITAGQKMKIKALWTWCKHKYELGKRMFDVTLYDYDVRADWCYKVTYKKATKEGQARAESSITIVEHQTFNGKHKAWLAARRFMEAYLYKEKNACGIPRTCMIHINGDTLDPVRKENFLGNHTQLGSISLKQWRYIRLY